MDSGELNKILVELENELTKLKSAAQFIEQTQKLTLNVEKLINVTRRNSDQIVHNAQELNKFSERVYYAFSKYQQSLKNANIPESMDHIIKELVRNKELLNHLNTEFKEQLSENLLEFKDTTEKKLDSIRENNKWGVKLMTKEFKTVLHDESVDTRNVLKENLNQVKGYMDKKSENMSKAFSNQHSYISTKINQIYYIIIGLLLVIGFLLVGIILNK